MSSMDEMYQTPLSSFTESSSGQGECEHRHLIQSRDTDLIQKLQDDNAGKGAAIKKLEQEVTQLQQRLKFAGQLEEQIIRLTTEQSEHDAEKKKLQEEIEKLQREIEITHKPTGRYTHEQQKLQEERTAKHYEEQYHEQIEVNINLQEKVAQLEKELQEAQVTYLGDEDDSQEVSQLKMHLRAKVSEVHSLSSKMESLQKHSKAQSKQVVQLKQELTALQVIFRRDAISQCDQYNLLS